MVRTQQGSVAKQPPISTATEAKDSQKFIMELIVGRRQDQDTKLWPDLVKKKQLAKQDDTD